MGFKGPSGRICVALSVLKKIFGVGLLLIPQEFRVNTGQAGVHCLGVASQCGGASHPPSPSLLQLQL